jgi:hypothetical protein
MYIRLPNTIISCIPNQNDAYILNKQTHFIFFYYPSDTSHLSYVNNYTYSSYISAKNLWRELTEGNKKLLDLVIGHEARNKSLEVDNRFRPLLHSALLSHVRELKRELRMARGVGGGGGGGTKCAAHLAMSALRPVSTFFINSKASAWAVSGPGRWTKLFFKIGLMGVRYEVET